MNIINDKNVYGLDLQMAWKKKHSNDLSWKTRPKWDLTVSD